ncbi:MAG: endolytic transglycosylase MltG [Oscillospiraceae bacterium]|nr:endolytic transglycosylase MltG [Oscillospiraceae bacterium]
MNINENNFDSERDINSFSDNFKNRNSYNFDDNPRKNKKKNNNKNRKFFKTMWFLMILFVSLTISRCLAIGIDDMLGLNRLENEIIIEIPKGSSKNDVALILEKNAIIREKDFFNFYTFMTKSFKTVVPGSFKIKTNLDYEALINSLQSNLNRLETDVVEITFREGLNLMECAALLEKNNVCSEKDFIEACKTNILENNYDFLKSVENSKERYFKYEGYLFPDTYKFYKNSEPVNILRKFLNNYEKKINSKRSFKDSTKGSVIHKAEERNMNMNNVLILASILQAEASDAKDMFKISSVFYNRLKTSENGGKSPFGDINLNKISSDATIYYPYRNEKDIPVDIAGSFKSNYNTYQIEGLPPGPICNPGIAAFEAALYPSETKNYYFCHGNDKTFFAEDSENHAKNLEKAGIRKNQN